MRKEKKREEEEKRGSEGIFFNLSISSLSGHVVGEEACGNWNLKKKKDEGLHHIILHRKKKSRGPEKKTAI